MRLVTRCWIVLFSMLRLISCNKDSPVSPLHLPPKMKTTLSLFSPSLLLFLLPLVKPVFPFALWGRRANSPLIVLAKRHAGSSPVLPAIVSRVARFFPSVRAHPPSQRRGLAHLSGWWRVEQQVLARPKALVGLAPPPPPLERLRLTGRLFALDDKGLIRV